MEDKNLYIFISKIALEFRLSLDNVCKILGKNTDDATKNEVYHVIQSLYADPDMTTAFEYLFNFETLNEGRGMSTIAFSKAVNFIKRYNQAKKEGRKEDIDKILKELSKTDEDYKNIKSKINNQEITVQVAEILTRYRIKYAISRNQIIKSSNVTRHVLENREDKIEDNALKIKLKLLSEYLLTREMSRRIKKY